MHGGIKLKLAGVMTSNHSEWATPLKLFNELNNEFHFTIDFCATKDNAKCNRFYDKKQNALLQFPKNEIIFCNPPYGREISAFVKKCFELSENNIIVMLIPSRTDTKYWHDYIEKKSEVRFIKGRVKFEGFNGKNEFIKNKPSTFPSAIIIWKKLPSGEKKT